MRKKWEMKNENKAKSKEKIEDWENERRKIYSKKCYCLENSDTQ